MKTHARVITPSRSVPKACFRTGRQTTATKMGEQVPIKFQIALPASRRPLVRFARCGNVEAGAGRGSEMEVAEKKLFIHYLKINCYNKVTLYDSPQLAPDRLEYSP